MTIYESVVAVIPLFFISFCCLVLSIPAGIVGMFFGCLILFLAQVYRQKPEIKKGFNP